MYLAIDPGRKNTGFAFFDEQGTVTAFLSITGEDKALDYLEEHLDGVKVAIIEQYRNRGGFVNDMSDMPTSQVIGAIRRILRKAKIEIVSQEPSPCLSIGLRFLGVYEEYYGEKKKHVPDEVSALAHGTYYLKKMRIIK